MKTPRIIYFDSYSILLINPSGKIRRLYTPFMVKCKESVNQLIQNSFLYVDEVFSDPDELLLYKIGGNIYTFKHFEITINF